MNRHGMKGTTASRRTPLPGNDGRRRLAFERPQNDGTIEPLNSLFRNWRTSSDW